MVKKKNAKSPAPSLDPDEREKQLINLAMNAAEKQMKDGTASSAVITHFLKMGSQRDKLEREKLIKETALLAAKSDTVVSGQKAEEDTKAAIEAMKHYSGESNADDHD